MAEYTTHSETDLRKELAQKREELRTFAFGASGSKARNPKAARNLRKVVARILTELTARSHTDA